MKSAIIYTQAGDRTYRFIWYEDLLKRAQIGFRVVELPRLENQCQGCILKWDFSVRGNHMDDYGNRMGCTADQYRDLTYVIGWDHSCGTTEIRSEKQLKEWIES